MSKQITIIILFIALAACSNKKSDIIGVEVDGEYYAVDHAAKEAAVNNDGKDKLICTHRQQTGTHFKQKRCTTVSQRNDDRKFKTASACLIYLPTRMWAIGIGKANHQPTFKIIQQIHARMGSWL